MKESVCDETNVLPENVISHSEWSEAQRKNALTEPDFRKWCLDLVAEREQVPLSTIINGGAEVHDCSTETIRRYVEKLTSEFGLLEIKANNDKKLVVVLREESGDA